MAVRQGRARRSVSWVSAAALVASSLVAVAAPVQAAPARPGVPGPAGAKNGAGRATPPVLRHKSSKVVLAPESVGGVRTSLVAANALKGTGEQRNGTLLSFPLTDRLIAKVNVGSGNLLVSSTDLTVPALGQDVAVGPVYNSLLIDSSLEVADYGHGWRARSGKEVALVDNGNSSLTYIDPSGVTGVFTVSGTAYTGDGAFKATLAHNGTGWKLTDHATGSITAIDSGGVVDSVTDRNGQTVGTGINSSGQSTLTGNRGAATPRTVTADFNTSNFIDWISQTGTDATTRGAQYTYDTAGNLKTITDARSKVTTFGYDSAHNLTSILTPIGKTTVSYDSTHRVTSLTRWNTVTNQGGITRLSYPSGTQTLLADANTDPAQAISVVPHTTYTINAGKRVTGVQDANGHSQSKTYNAFNDVATSTDAYTKVTTNTYGANSGESITKTQLPTGAANNWAYTNTATSTNPTANFQASSSSDAQSNATTYSYNGTGNTLQAQNALAAAAKVTYNTDGTVATSTDPANGTNASTYGYNTDKQLTSYTPPTGTTLGGRTFTYDAYARLRTATDGAGRTSTYSYDKNDRVTDVAYSDGTTTVHSVYDDNGNLTTRTDASGTSTWTINTLNQITNRSLSGFTNNQSWGYDWVGNITSFTDGRGTNVYTYDPANQMSAMTTSGGSLRYTFAYDDNGRRTITRFNSNAAGTTSSLATVQSFDDSGRIKSIVATLNNDVNNVGFDAAYCYTTYTAGQPCATTGDSNVLRWKKDFGTTVTTYSYDAGNRNTGASGSGHSKVYGYNSNGSRTGVTTDGATSQTLTFNAGNQISTTGYTHDGAGNQLTAPTDTGRTYNAAQQMLTSHGGGQLTTFTYAGTGQNELATSANTAYTTYYDYTQPDPNGVPQLSSYHVVNNSTAAQTDYYIERDPTTAQPLGIQWVSGGVHHHYGYITDNVGTINNLVDTTGGLASTGYDTWPYGENRSTITSYDTISTNNNQRYAAGTKIAELVKFGTRWYDTTTGRFTQQDALSILGDPANGNRYSYAADNPVTNTDPTGNSVSTCLGFFGANLLALASLAAVPVTGGASAVVLVALAAGGSVALDVATVNSCRE